MRFHDRQEAGRHLAVLLERHRGEDPIVLALPRGGVPVGYEVARALGAPLDVVVVRKLGAPQFPEYAIGAIAEGGAVFVDSSAIAEAGVAEAELTALAEAETIELVRRVRRYRGERPFPEVRGKTVILVDDGIATGRTARAAIRTLRDREPRQIVLAAPVVASDTAALLRGEVDDLVYVDAPERFVAVALWYERFEQTTDEEVVALLAQARRARAPRQGDSDAPSREWDGRGADAPAVRREAVAVAAGDRVLRGDLALPPDARGIVLFAHGSGSGRFSPRNRHVAWTLRESRFATLLLDLLTSDEEVEDEISGRLRFDVDFLARRLAGAVRFVLDRERTRELPVGLFGASTGAAAALVTASLLPEVIAAVVSRGGRPDFTGSSALRLVEAPTLLIVGSKDEMVLDLNRAAFEQLRCEKKLVVVPGASHLFEEAGTLAVVARLAAGWFEQHLVQRPEAGSRAPGTAKRTR
jgi:putative phosphoribosyl transferase